MDLHTEIMTFLSSCLKAPLREYHYVNIKMTWHEAQQYCRQEYTDLATIESMEDISRLKADFSNSWAWIGLKDDPKWSTTGETSRTGFSNWKFAQPNSGYGHENCVQMGSGGLWDDKNCESLKASVCYNGKKRVLFTSFNYKTFQV
uniref:C-type lectin domain-containing protein n=1 Tax=Stegastes partitus TaxID=144197 RepID=A0A3B4ZAY1_9TELE